MRKWTQERNSDEVENGGINWGEITKIAGQVNQIGKILGFDAEDLNNWSASVSGSYSSNNDLENKFRIKKIFNGARKIAKIGAALGYSVEDLDDLGVSKVPKFRIGCYIKPRFTEFK